MTLYLGMSSFMRAFFPSKSQHKLSIKKQFLKHLVSIILSPIISISILIIIQTLIFLFMIIILLRHIIVIYHLHHHTMSLNILFKIFYLSIYYLILIKLLLFLCPMLMSQKLIIKRFSLSLEECHESKIDALEDNGTWSVVPLPSDSHFIDSKWVYKVKMNADGNVERYNVRFAAKGYNQRESFDYQETFSPMAKQPTATNDVMQYLSSKFKLKDLRCVKYFLSLEVARSDTRITIYQQKYTLGLLKELGLLGAKLVFAPMDYNQKPICVCKSNYAEVMAIKVALEDFYQSKQVVKNALMVEFNHFFNGNNYPMWAVKMKAYLKAFDLWEVVEVGGDPPARQANPTIAQMKQYNEEVAKRFKALSCIHSVVTDAVFVRIMACESAKEAWDKIKEEFHGSDHTRQIQILNLLRKFEVLKMKDEETMKNYFDKVLRVVNQALRQEDHVEATLAARRVDKRTSSGSHKKFEHEKKDKDKRPHVKCRACNQKGHVEKVCKNKENRVEEKAAIMEQKEDAEETLFMVIESNDLEKDSIWLIDSACSMHITGKIKNFLDLNKAYKSTVEIRDGNLLEIEGRGTVGITTKKVFNEDLHWNWMKNEIAENNNDNVAINLDVFEEEAGHELDDNIDDIPAPRAWYEKIDGYLRSNKFFRSESEPTLYVKSSLGKIQLIVSVYVDDLLIIGSNKTDLKSFKNKMKSEFDMSELGEMSYFLGLEIQQRSEFICLHQKKYARKLLKRFKMEGCKPMSTPLATATKLCKDDGRTLVDVTQYRKLIGCLLYLSASRLDIMYVRGTLNYGFLYGQVENKELEGYSDSDWARSYDDLKSTGGYCFSFGSAMFSWNSKKQDIIAQSSAKAEYVAAASATNQALWLKKVLLDLKFEQINPTVLWLDNQSAIALAKDPINTRSCEEQ
ncbi:Uncharacterized protein TCM_024658 [Theobroma cacao]|uniref:Cysteine-rich RLK (RECEPTOR-like protein kinase) 8 n=1 Tax=Theobroma cacao TaxID=3641 RepID=A0A061EW06_THECC|nr:Uncharacterized protein TCM_024658 [Theobroma cacao]